MAVSLSAALAAAWSRCSRLSHNVLYADMAVSPCAPGAAHPSPLEGGASVARGSNDVVRVKVVVGTVPITTQSFHGVRFMGKRKEDFFVHKERRITTKKILFVSPRVLSAKRDPMV